MTSILVKFSVTGISGDIIIEKAVTGQTLII